MNRAYLSLPSKHPGHPFHLNCGKHPRLPSDLTLSSERKKGVKDAKAVDFFGNIEKAEAKACLQAAQQRQKTCANEKRVDVQYEIGEMAGLNRQHVTLKAVGTRKLLSKWLGPFKILAKPRPVNYVLDTPAHYRIHTICRLSICCAEPMTMVLEYSDLLSS